MKGKIDKLGYLWIERTNMMKEQHCLEHLRTTTCGDQCPQFGEPHGGQNTKKITLDICQGRDLWFDEFTDERENAT